MVVARDRIWLTSLVSIPFIAGKRSHGHALYNNYISRKLSILSVRIQKILNFYGHDRSTDQSGYQSNLFSSHGLEQYVCKFFMTGANVGLLRIK